MKEKGGDLVSPLEGKKCGWLDVCKKDRGKTNVWYSYDIISKRKREDFEEDVKGVLSLNKEEILVVGIKLNISTSKSKARKDI